MTDLNAHFEKMQEMAARYLEPGDYVGLQGQQVPDYAVDGASIVPVKNTARYKTFINDIIYMLDGPEQREVQR